MKRITISLAILIITFFNVNAQEIGKLAPEKPPMTFPDNAFGADILFSEGGFGLGAFYHHHLSQTITGFVDFSISEAKDEQEFSYTYQDYYGNIYNYTYGKENRIFLLPINFGIQYRLFENVIYDNLRPYINFGIGPTLVLTSPYDKEFFNAFGSAHANYALGGYTGFGANFGIDKSSLIGINIRYYFIHLFNKGVESLYGRPKKDLGGVFLSINLGLMY
jgi:hypothetical protein